MESRDQSKPCRSASSRATRVSAIVATIGTLACGILFGCESSSQSTGETGESTLDDAGSGRDSGGEAVNGAGGNAGRAGFSAGGDAGSGGAPTDNSGETSGSGGATGNGGSGGGNGNGGTLGGNAGSGGTLGDGGNGGEENTLGGGAGSGGTLGGGGNGGEGGTLGGGGNGGEGGTLGGGGSGGEGGTLGDGGSGGEGGTLSGGGNGGASGGTGGLDDLKYSACQSIGGVTRAYVFRIDRSALTCTILTFVQAGSCDLGLNGDGWCLDAASVGFDAATCEEREPPPDAVQGGQALANIVRATGATGSFSVLQNAQFPTPRFNLDVSLQFPDSGSFPETVDVQAEVCSALCGGNDCQL